MHFPFHARKAAQATAYLVWLHGGVADAFRLLKLLYLADRECLVRRGFPITGDCLISTPDGPALARISEAIAQGKPGPPLNAYLMVRAGDLVVLRTDSPPTDELSDFERNVLDDVHRRYGHLDPEQLRELSRSLPEFGSMEGPIDPAAILRHAGWTEEEIAEAETCANEASFFARLTHRG
jgi:uncharacterized phage-associated protein